MAAGPENGPVAVAPSGDGEVWDAAVYANGGEGDQQLDSPLYATDEFRMYGFKIARCGKKFSHDWTQCPFAHPGEKARRRDPQQYKYAAIACIDMKKNGTCPRGDSCPYAHNVFEYWMHPTRYRTQICNDGANCSRSVCFFAHRLEELRMPPHKPGFPPEWRNRRHGRTGSIGAGREASRGGQANHASPLLSRALSVPAALPSDKPTPHKMQMSDGTWGSPIRHLPRMKSVSCPTGVDPFGSSPCSGAAPPNVWNPGPLSPFSQIGGYPLSARGHRRSVDSSPLAEQGNENVAGMILQLIDSLSRQPAGCGGGVPHGPSNNVRSSSLDSSQIRALQLAAVERAWSTRSSVDAQSARSSIEDHSPHTQRGLESELRMMGAGGVAGIGNQMPPSQCAPFPMMSRGVDVPPGFMQDGSNGAGNPEARGAAGLVQHQELHPQVSGVSL